MTQLILLLGTYPEKTVMQTDACTPMLTAAPFTTARTWKDLDVHQIEDG